MKMRGAYIVLSIFLQVVTIYAQSITLTWSDNSTNEKGWRIDRVKGRGVFEEIAVIKSTTQKEATTSREAIKPSWSDHTVEPGFEYSYRVQAFNDFGYSGYTNVSKKHVEGPPNGDPSAAETEQTETPKKLGTIEFYDNGAIKHTPATTLPEKP